MLYFIFRKIYLKMKKNIERENVVRIGKEILPPGIVKTTYEYIEDGHSQHFCNIYKVSGMEDSKNLPLIIDIHGGGWICGDKDTNDNFNYHLALQKNNVTSLSYRTVDECTLLQQVKDIFAYFHFLRDSSNKLEISFHEVMLIGDTAGAQLELLSYCINQSPELQKLFGVRHVDISVSCLVLNHGVCYLNHAGRLAGKPFVSKYISVLGLQRMVYGKKFSKSGIYSATASPMAYVSKKTGMECEIYFEKTVNAGHVFNIAYPDSEMAKSCNGYINVFFKRMRQS